MTTRIAIFGDIYPRSIKKVPSFDTFDFAVANLECAVTESENKIKKDGPSLKVSSDELKEVAKSFGIKLFGLANNHVLDYGAGGLKDTISTLTNLDVDYAGCSVADNYRIIPINEIKFGFYFLSEHQYNYIGNDCASVNLIGNRCFEEIKSLRKKCDFLIVLFHGGKEYYRYPTPLQQKNCHEFIDSGVDFVVCQHSHCVGCEEIYKDKHIIYGQGNTVFPFSNKEEFKTGIVIELEFDSSKNYTISYIPIVHTTPGEIEIANSEQKETILNGFMERTKILSEVKANNLYEELLKKDGFDFFYRLFNKGKLYTRLDCSRLFKNRMMKRYLRKNQNYLLYLYNYFNCETHREYIKELIKRQIK